MAKDNQEKKKDEKKKISVFDAEMFELAEVIRYQKLKEEKEHLSSSENRFATLDLQDQNPSTETIDLLENLFETRNNNNNNNNNIPPQEPEASFIHLKSKTTHFAKSKRAFKEHHALDALTEIFQKIHPEKTIEILPVSEGKIKISVFSLNEKIPESAKLYDKKKVDALFQKNNYQYTFENVETALSKKQQLQAGKSTTLYIESNYGKQHSILAYGKFKELVKNDNDAPMITYQSGRHPVIVVKYKNNKNNQTLDEDGVDILFQGLDKNIYNFKNVALILQNQQQMSQSK